MDTASGYPAVNTNLTAIR